METSAWIILIAAIFTNNILLSNFLGMCSFLACSSQMATAMGLSAAVTFVTSFTAAINYGIYHGVLVENAPLCRADLTHLTFIIFIAVIAGFVQFIEMVIERFSQRLYYALGVFLPLITVNCAILGACLFLVYREYNFWQSVGYGFGAGVGWAMAILLMAGLRQKMAYSNVPVPFRGVAVIMIVTGLMAMSFFGFSGMVMIN